jgi:hypothetical protein
LSSENSQGWAQGQERLVAWFMEAPPLDVGSYSSKERAMFLWGDRFTRVQVQRNLREVIS